MNLGLKCYQCGGVAGPECPSADSEDYVFYEFLTECDGVCHNETNIGNGKTIRKCMALGNNELGCTTVNLPFGGTSIGIDLFQNVSI